MWTSKEQGDKTERMVAKDHICSLPVMVAQNRGLFSNSLFCE